MAKDFAMDTTLACLEWSVAFRSETRLYRPLPRMRKQGVGLRGTETTSCHKHAPVAGKRCIEQGSPWLDRCVCVEIASESLFFASAADRVLMVGSYWSVSSSIYRAAR